MRSSQRPSDGSLFPLRELVEALADEAGLTMSERLAAAYSNAKETLYSAGTSGYCECTSPIGVPAPRCVGCHPDYSG